MAFQADNTQTSTGQMFPEDFGSDFAVINFIARQIVAEMETCTPVQVTAVHPGSGSPPGGGTVDVQLLLSLLDGNGKATKQGIVYGLPFFRLQSTNWALIADPAVNDFGFIISASRDTSNVVKTPGMANPGSFRTHSFSDGFFLPCPFNSAAPAGTVWLKPDGSLQLTTKDGVVIQSDGSGNLTITASGNTNVTTPVMTINGELRVTGEITAGFGQVDNVTLLNHKHIDSTGHQTTKPLAGT